MRVGRTLRGLSAIGALLLTLTAGCTISIQPWSKPVAPALPGNGPVDLLPPNPNGPYPLPRPGGMLSAGAQFGPNNEMIAQLGAKLSNAEDQLNTVQAYVTGLKREKGKQDEQLAQSTREIEQTLSQIKQLRQELKQWKADVEDMSIRVQKLEENRAMMKLLLDRVESYLTNDREAKVFGPKLR